MVKMLVDTKQQKDTDIILKMQLHHPENYNLLWNEFDRSTSNAFRALFCDTDFADVTLVCEGDKQIKAHKVILSACSVFFKNILLKNPHQHPLIYLNGAKFAELQSIVRFVYSGQTEVAQEDLEHFFKTATELQIQGLTQESGLIQNPATTKSEVNCSQKEEVSTLGNSVFVKDEPSSKKEDKLNETEFNPEPSNVETRQTRKQESDSQKDNPDPDNSKI